MRSTAGVPAKWSAMTTLAASCCPAQRRASLSHADLDWDLVVAAVIGHHLKADAAGFGNPMNADRNVFAVYAEGIADLVSMAQREVEANRPFDLEIGPCWTIDGVLGEQASKCKREIRRVRDRIRKDENVRRLLWAVRAALIVADAAGSGLAREGHTVSDWLKRAFSDRRKIDAPYIDEKVIVPRIEAIEKETRKRFRWNDFQTAAETLSSRALLLASCGAGKTLAAWCWIRDNSHGASCQGHLPISHAGHGHGRFPRLCLLVCPRRTPH